MNYKLARNSFYSKLAQFSSRPLEMFCPSFAKVASPTVLTDRFFLPQRYLAEFSDNLLDKHS